MPKKIDIVISESVKELKALSRRKHVKGILFVRVKMLILLKGGALCYGSQLANELGKERHTIYEWIKKYKKGGIRDLLTLNNKNNAKQVISEELKKIIIKV